MLEFERFGVVVSTVSGLFSNTLFGDSEVPSIGDSEHIQEHLTSDCRG